MKNKRKTVMIGVEELVPDPNQPRKTFASEGMDSLASSLVETGQLVPIMVRPGQRGKYLIVVGERRWLAAKQAGLSKVECIVLRDLDDQKVREVQLAENCDREDIPPLELGRSLMEYFRAHPDVSQSELSRRIGLPQRTISARLTLVSLPESVQSKVEAGNIGPHEATKIATLPAQIQDAVADAVSSGRIKGRKLDRLAKQARDHPEMAIGDIIERLASHGDGRVSQTETVDAPSPVLAPATSEDIDSSTNTIDANREVGQTQLVLSIAQAPSDADFQLAAIRLVGLDIRNECPYSKESLCSFWSWGRQDRIPGVLGELVDTEKQRRLRPSPLCCAMCVGVLSQRIVLVSATPPHGQAEALKCGCGRELEVGYAVRCESCGHEVWWCWQPKASIRAVA